MVVGISAVEVVRFVWRTSAAWWCAQPGGEIQYINYRAHPTLNQHQLADWFYQQFGKRINQIKYGIKKIMMLADPVYIRSHTSE